MTESSEYQFNSICVFCGSSPGANPVYLEAANEVGKYLADNGITLIYGGGQLGLMGAIADATLANGGKVIGVIPDALAVAEVAHARLTELHVVKTMHERKALMAELSDAFIALPGGFGTFEEYCEMLTWGQLDIHRKPVGLLNVNNYFDPLIQLFDHANSEGFIHDRYRKMALVDTDLNQLVEKMLEASKSAGAPIYKWLE